MEYLIAFAISLIAGLVAIIVYERKNALNAEYRLDAQSLSIMKLALSLLSEQDREFYEDEWFMFLFDQPTSSKRLIQACSFMVAAGKIASLERAAKVAGVFLISREYVFQLEGKSLDKTGMKFFVPIYLMMSLTQCSMLWNIINVTSDLNLHGSLFFFTMCWSMIFGLMTVSFKVFRRIKLLVFCYAITIFYVANFPLLVASS